MDDAARQVDPLSLRFHEGQWVMKVSTLQRVCDVVFVPKTYLIEGVDSILACLRDQENQHELFVATEKLFAGMLDAPSPEYRPEKGRWVPRRPKVPTVATVPAPEPPVEDDDEPEDVEQLHERIRLLEDRLRQLEDLEQRLARLEAVSQSPPPDPPEEPSSCIEPAPTGGNYPPSS